MVEKVLQLNNEKTIFWSLLGVLLLSVGFYMYFINTTIHNVVARQNIEERLSQITLSIGSHEFEYIKMKSEVTLPLAYSLGFQDVQSKTFISKASLNQVSLNN